MNINHYAKLQAWFILSLLLKLLAESATEIQAVFFLPEFYHFKQWHADTMGVIHSLKLVTRATRGNKALSTNNTASLVARVDPLLHLFNSESVLQVLLLTKLLEGISMLYTFLFKGIARRDLSNTRKSIEELPTYTLRKQAESEQQARAFFAPFYVILEGGLVC